MAKKKKKKPTPPGVFIDFFSPLQGTFTRYPEQCPSIGDSQQSSFFPSDLSQSDWILLTFVILVAVYDTRDACVLPETWVMLKERLTKSQ